MEKQVISIDPNGKYVIIVRGGSEQSSFQLSKDLEKWWDTGGTFFVLTVVEDIEITLEKLEDV